MKLSLIATTLLLSASLGGLAQNSTNANKTTNGTDQKNTGSAEGLERKGNGKESPKMKSGVSRSGNSNLSPTGPTNTHGSTSEGSGSVQATGGATGTGTRQKTRGGVKGAQNARNNTATDGGTTGPGATSGGNRSPAPKTKATTNKKSGN